ncbi:MAG: FG-GAP-like repeat-containing protein, partial [Pyrinomonadaceae bacterium]
MRLPDHYRLAPLIIPAAVFMFVAGCQTGARLPGKSSKEYADAVRTFYVGLAALQVGDDVRADAELAGMTRLVAGEPAGWANWGLLALRQRNFDDAALRLERARSLAPESDQIQYLIGLLESGRGRPAEAVAALRKAVELNPGNLVATFKLAEEIEREGDENGEAEFQRLVGKILEAQPDNLAALLELARVAAKRGDAETLRAAVGQISARSSGWPPEVQEQLSAVESAAAADPRAAATRVAFLRNVLVRVPEFRQSLAAIKPPPGEEAQPFTHFLRLETPTFAPAPADTALTFTTEQLPNVGDAHWNWIGAISLDGEGAPTVVEANGREVRLAGGATYSFPGGASATPPGPEGVTGMDFNYDFKTDLVLAGAGGVRLLRQDDANTFTDVTAQAKLPASIVNAAYLGAWAADVDADGDLDIVLGAAQGLPVVLRNNGDGTFAEARPFANVYGLRGFAWADIDADGDADAAVIDGANRLHVFANERAGQFNERALPPSLPPVRAVAVADVNGDGVFDLLVVQADGVIVRLSDQNEGKAWDAAEVAHVSDAPNFLEGEFRLLVADLDNNGGIDLVLTSNSPSATAPTGKEMTNALTWLSDERGNFKQLDKPSAAPRVFGAADLDGDGRLDLLGLTADGQPARAVSRGAKNYHWQQVRPRAAKAVGDQRINSFGVGGEMEIRAGLLAQKQLITSPLVHFGLGDETGADVVRIVWPNGSVRAEFELKADETITAEQRLKG